MQYIQVLNINGCVHVGLGIMNITTHNHNVELMFVYISNLSPLGLEKLTDRSLVITCFISLIIMNISGKETLKMLMLKMFPIF